MRFVVVLMVLASAGSAQAQLQNELTGPRSAAMGGAHRGLGTSNDALYLNPAGMSLAKRYNVSGVVSFVPDLWRYNVSIVDSKTGPMAGGVGYTFDTDDDTSLHRMYVGASYPLSESMFLGITNRYLVGSFKDVFGRKRDVSTYTADVGLMLKLGESVSVGASYNNLLRGKVPRLTPPTAGGGIGIQSGVFGLAADASVNLRREDERPWSFRAGAEVFLGNAFPVRLGYAREATDLGPKGFENDNIITGGLGWVSDGFGLDFTYRRELVKDGEQSFVGALQLYR